MKTNHKRLIKKIILGIVVFGGIGFLHILNKNNGTESHKDSLLSAKLQEIDGKIWQELGKLNITKNTLTKKSNQLQRNYLQEISVRPTRRRVKESTRQLIYETLREFDLNPEDIHVVSEEMPSPASSTEVALYINEKTFCKHSTPAQRFIIAHEIQHILNGDSLHDFVLDRVIDEKPLNPRMANKVLNTYSQLVELRADLQAATTNSEWAQRYLIATQETLEQVGDNSSSTHPKNSERLNLARTIVNQMNKQTIL